MSDLAKLVVKLEAQTAQYVSALESANKKLSKFQKDQEVSLGGIGKAFGAVATAAATALALLVKNAVDSADHMNDLSKATGVSVENLSRLEFAAKQSGGDLDSLSVGLKKLNLSIAEAAGNAKSDAALAFSAMGVSVTDASGRIKSADQVLLQIADRFQTFRDGANKNEIAMALFGKSFEKLIPLLNEGSRNITEMGDRAAEVGAVISTDAAKAADEFNDRLGEMKAQVTGVGNQVAALLLPSFNALAKEWEADAGRAEALNAIAGVIAATLKGLVTVGITVVSIFQQVGQAIYSINAASFDLLKLDFKGALSELQGGFGNIADNVSHDFDKIKKLWDTSPLNPVVMDKAMASGGHGPIKRDFTVEAPNLTAIKEAAKAQEEALKKAAAAAEAAKHKLSDMNADLMEQVKTFGLGDAAATEYRLTLGSLSDDVAKAGKAGKEIAKSIIAQADALEKLKNAEAVGEIDRQIQSLTGHTVEAATAAFDLQNALLKASLIRQDDEAGLKKLATLRSLIESQAKYNELELEAERIREDLRVAEERIQHSQEVGATGELDALHQLDEARKKALEQLGAIYDKQKAIADQSGNPQMVDEAKKSAAALEELRGQTDLLAQHIKSGIQDTAATAFADFLDGTKSASDAFSSFLNDLERQILEFASKELMRQLFNAILPSGGDGGGFLGSLAGLFGGSRDSGGRGQPGKAYAIGTGAQPEMFIPDSHGTFVPNNMMGTQVVQNFHIEAPKGTVSKATQLQIGTEAARSLAMAQRRNG